MRVAVVGAGGHGKVVADAAAAQGLEVAGFLDDDEQLRGLTLAGASVLGPIASWPSLGLDGLVPAIGSNRARSRVVAAEAARGAVFETIVHPRAVVSVHAKIGAGVAVLGAAVVNADAVIADGAILNTGAIVEHDCRIGAFAHIAPNATLAGGVTVGEGTLVGAGATVLPGVAIGRWCVIGAGTVVVRDAPDGATVYGVPGRRA